MCNFLCNYNATNQNMTRLKIRQLAYGLFNFFVFKIRKFIELISIIEFFAVKMVTCGTPWNVH